jgi:AcrR family transcriptional regulator
MMSSGAPETRERILKSTLALLEKGEADAARMADIAKRAGVTRQALYLHFANRAELLIAVTRYVEELHGSDARLAPSRAAKTGVERLDAFIEAWAGFLPEIHRVAKALILLSETDEAAKIAWAGRMDAMRHGCAAAIMALHNDRALSPGLSPKQATDLLLAMLSVQTWEQLTLSSGWTHRDYAQHMKAAARRLFVKSAQLPRTGGLR